jgi:Family of unknown function (DUF6496)
MPSKTTIKRAQQDKREGKKPSTQAGEFVKEEMDHIREGKHGARSTKQAIAIGLSKARKAGVDLPAPKRGRVSERTRRSAERAHEEGQGKAHRIDEPPKPSARRSRAAERALKREGHSAASHAALSRHAKSAAAARRRRGGVSEGVGKPASASKRASKSSRKRASSSTRRASSARRRTSTKRTTTRRRRAASTT